MAEQDICPHLDSIGEVTKEDLLQKSKVGFHLFTVNMSKMLSPGLCSCSSLFSISPHCDNNRMSWNKCWKLCLVLFYCVYLFKMFVRMIYFILLLSIYSAHVCFPLLQGTCQSCGAGGPNLWACLQVRKCLEVLSFQG